jgi:competence protein ComEA
MLKKSLLGALAALCAASVFAGVELNKADQAALEGVHGLGPALSSKLLEERKKGPYKSWEDVIDRVRGVGPASAARLSTAGLTVNDSPYAGAKAPTSQPGASPAAAGVTGAAKATKPAAPATPAAK